MRVCSCIGCPAHDGSCPELTTARRCEPCSGQAEQKRGRRQARGYDRAHERLREQWRPRVEAGLVDCHAQPCTQPILRILPGALWDLGHDRATGQHRGPEHRACNRSDGGRAAHGG
jgi:hypothetical protein